MPKRYVEGIGAVSKAFRSLTGPKQVIGIARALDKGGAEIANYARVLVPEADGDTRASIGHRIVPVSREKAAVAVVVEAGGRQAPGAWRSEFGRDPGGSGDNQGHPGHEEQPFLFPAYHALRKRARRRVARAVNAAAKEAAIRGR